MFYSNCESYTFEQDCIEYVNWQYSVPLNKCIKMYHKYFSFKFKSKKSMIADKEQWKPPSNACNLWGHYLNFSSNRF